MTLECEVLVSWFLAVNLPVWPHACDFFSGFLGGYLPVLWTLHHRWGKISEFHLWSASGLFIKHNCLPGPEPSLDSEKVHFLIVVFSLNYPAGWSLLEAMDSLSPCPKNEQSPGVGFVGERFVSVWETVESWRQWRQDFGAAQRSLTLIAHICPTLSFIWCVC